MGELLAALEWRDSFPRRLAVVGYIMFLSAAFTVGGYALTLTVPGHGYMIELLLWAPWLLWLGYFFPRDHLRAAAAHSSYRRSFFRHVGPGISWNFAQMARPGLAGLAEGGFAHLRPGPVAAGLVLVAAGGVAIGAALRAIGVSRALFVSEYRPDGRPLVTASIYHWLRHPLIAGGVFVSVGIGVFFSTPDALWMSLANAAVLPAYQLVEDARCRKVFVTYRSYQRDVSGVILTPRRLYQLLSSRR
jgi:protein-S-isoprenylcysteine O-methyltransferase Ste14